MPEYPDGGLSGLMTYLSQNIKYPETAYKEGREGRVIIRFVVDRDGSLGEFEIIQHSYPDLDAEALRVVKAMPKWKPGKHNGKAVRSRMNVPISFKIPK